MFKCILILFTVICGLIVVGIIINPIQKKHFTTNSAQNVQTGQNGAQNASPASPSTAPGETKPDQGNTKWDWHNAFTPPTWSNWALVLIGTLGICAAIRSLDILRVQTEATKASADAAVSAERAWIMVDLEKVPGVGTIIVHGATQEGSGPQRYSTSVRVRCVCSNQGKTPAKIIEKKMAVLLVTGNKPLPIEPELQIEILDPVPEYLQTRDESKQDWTLEVDGRQENGDMLIAYGIIRYTHLFSATEAHTTFGFRVTINNTFQRLTGYPKYNENT
jgi:hypothetical protein